MATKQARAHNAVSYAISRGNLPSLDTQKCLECGKTATRYHHHNGYDRKHRLDVVPLCGRCHYAAHAHENKRHALSDDDVRLARQMKRDGKSIKEIANHFGYDAGNMAAVLRKQAYYWVD